jgi:L-ascorbate metabolism protein UlaG (beta-lactamase superfamily)
MPGWMTILTDPVWSERAGPFSFVGPKRVTKPGIDFDDLPPIDGVLLSHSHYDHFDVATLRRLHAVHSPLMVMPLGNDVIVRAAVPGARCVVGDWWDRLISVDACPTIVIRKPETRSFGFAGATGKDFGQRAAALVSRHRRTSASPLSVDG